MIEGQISDWQIERLKEIAALVEGIPGVIIEIGCWKGKSTAAIANVVHPETLHAVDTWMGNIDEGKVTGKIHPTVKEAQRIDIFKIFQENMATHTQGNVVPHKQDCFEYLAGLEDDVKFCHIDASHDYVSVKHTLEMLLPKMVEGGILVGDDFQSANMHRKDLEGGVEKAVRECLPGFRSKRNYWWWKK
jgi:predicted O-methyltransferase YrrM